MSDPPPIHGFVADGFERVREAFEANWERRGEVGAALCVYRDGRLVVDLRGGWVDRTATDDYPADGLQVVYSATKGISAMAAAVLVDRGVLDLEAPVATYWPEFAGAGKAGVTVRSVLSHQAGVPAVDTPLTTAEVLAVGPVLQALETQHPLWPAGEGHGYHAFTLGWIIGEVVRRITGKPIGDFIRDELCAPLGAEFWIGLPTELEPRVVPLLPPPAPSTLEELAFLLRVGGPGTLGGRALSMDGALLVADLDGTPFNSREYHASSMPAGNGISNARSMARLYAACIGEVDGVRLFGPSTMTEFATECSAGVDRVLSMQTKFGLGFGLDCELFYFGSETAFGHYGAGGSAAFADPARGLAFAYVMNYMATWLGHDPRVKALIDATRACDFACYPYADRQSPRTDIPERRS
ncbi:MAG: beta-lactamase family protein [Actinobacteria bacterium]|nr:beta-lactamase family protein [Actinomycetota bacterium]